MPVPNQVRDDVSGIPANRPAGRQKKLKSQNSGFQIELMTGTTGVTL